MFGYFMFRVVKCRKIFKLIVFVNHNICVFVNIGQTTIRKCNIDITAASSSQRPSFWAIEHAYMCNTSKVMHNNNRKLKYENFWHVSEKWMFLKNGLGWWVHIFRIFDAYLANAGDVKTFSAILCLGL